jgi:hypothetical protein
MFSRPYTRPICGLPPPPAQSQQQYFSLQENQKHFSLQENQKYGQPLQPPTAEAKKRAVKTPKESASKVAAGTVTLGRDGQTTYVCKAKANGAHQWVAEKDHKSSSTGAGGLVKPPQSLSMGVPGFPSHLFSSGFNTTGSNTTGSNLLLPAKHQYPQNPSYLSLFHHGIPKTGAKGFVKPMHIDASSSLMDTSS